VRARGECREDVRLRALRLCEFDEHIAADRERLGRRCEYRRRHRLAERLAQRPPGGIARDGRNQFEIVGARDAARQGGARPSGRTCQRHSQCHLPSLCVDAFAPLVRGP
jgi:hypothetical protein